MLKFLSTLSLRRATSSTGSAANFSSGFLSTLSLRRATFCRTYQSNCCRSFLSTLSLRRATTRFSPLTAAKSYFYPRSPCGERLLTGCLFDRGAEFLSTLSLRRATGGRRQLQRHRDHFYPRSPCGERPNNVLPAYAACGISIHALLAESDHTQPTEQAKALISIHALLAESDFGPISMGFIGGLFLSTLSLRRATFVGASQGAIVGFLSTLSLRRATRLFFIVFDLFRFLSTLSLRRATVSLCYMILLL